MIVNKSHLQAALLGLALGSCCAPATVPVSDLDPLLPMVLDRYEAWVEAGVKPDGTPFQQDALVDEQAVWLATAEELRAYLEAAREGAEGGPR